MGHHPKTWFHIIPGVDHHNVHMVTASFIVLILIAGTWIVYPRVRDIRANLVPEKKFNLKSFFELLVEVLAGLSRDIIGPHHYKYLPFVGTIFIFIFFSNLIGMVPGFLPPTENWATGTAIAIISFIAYNYFGFSEHGPSYLKHFLAPISIQGVKSVALKLFLIIPLVAFHLLFGTIEIMSNFIRPVTLSVRLFINIFVDHLVLGIFSGLVPILLPIIFMVLGIFVCFMQAFIFTVLSMVYISLATAHDH
ncbi:MAG TPA: F0F1 ATP synthase subunit A [Oligoflexia bacterium]|nr:F0F1 ATP synthase subunit A [Oligoflexia bacterium]HMR25601.1 F0F1 ATP synthase subunit A [Oligoflexia bacterium]